MVKADAYNHGMLLCKEIQSQVDSFGVSSTKEGILLRELGIKNPIKVVAFEKEHISDAAFFNLIPVVADVETLKVLVRYNKKFEIDVKIDCGMNRLGVNNIFDLYEILRLLKANENIKINSLFSHFSFDSYEKMLEQSNRFIKYCNLVEEEFGKLSKSISASSGLCYGEKFLFDEIRAGLAIYGYMPNGTKELKLRKAMSITVPIVAIKEVKKGDKIGYSGLYIANKDVKIGIIRGGYYDGISRQASGFKVFVNGQETELIGSVCMDLSFVLLDNGIKAKEGDNVILIGEENDIYDLAKHCKTIPYEIMTSFKGRIKRIYYL